MGSPEPIEQAQAVVLSEPIEDEDYMPPRLAPAQPEPEAAALLDVPQPEPPARPFVPPRPVRLVKVRCFQCSRVIAAPTLTDCDMHFITSKPCGEALRFIPEAFRWQRIKP